MFLIKDQYFHVLLIIPNEDWWHFISVKKLSEFLREITSKYDIDFFDWFVFIGLEQKASLNPLKKYVKKKFNIVISSKDTNQYHKCDEASLTISEDLDCLNEKNDGCKNITTKSSTTKVGENMFYQVFQWLQYQGIENKPEIYRNEDCMETFCESLRQCVGKIINLENKKRMK